MVTKEVAEAIGGLKKLTPTGTSVLIEGTLAQTPEGTKQVRDMVCKVQRASMHLTWSAGYLRGKTCWVMSLLRQYPGDRRYAPRSVTTA